MDFERKPIKDTDTRFCGRCTSAVHIDAAQCENCLLDFNGSGRFQRLDCKPPTSMLRALLDELCNEVGANSSLGLSQVS